MLTPEQVNALAQYFKIDNASIIREYLQLLFLRSFYSLKESQEVFFKGGTAIHFHCGSFRFSEDLDFSCRLTATRIHKLLEESVKPLIDEIASLELVDLGHQHNSFNGRLRLKYKGSHYLAIRLEFSQREKPLTHEVSMIETRFPLVSYPLVVHLDAEELLAEKVRAILIRGKGRDFFDLWYLLSKGTAVRNDYIREKMKWYRKSYVPQDLVRAVKKANEKNLWDDLARFLPKPYRPEIAKIIPDILQKIAIEKKVLDKV
jgi:predicted nucleotidyltransferase component of viral defense system